jgi:hypothetical protein
VFGRNKGSKRGSASPEEIYNGLRSTALAAAISRQIPRHEDHPDVYGLVIDMPGQGGSATVVALGDNSTSLYTSTGSGIIGAGERPAVAASTQRLLTVAQDHLGSFTGNGDGRLPERGTIRLHVLIGQASPVADIPEDAFWGRSPHPLRPLIAAAQGVISALRNVHPG